MKNPLIAPSSASLAGRFSFKGTTRFFACQPVRLSVQLLFVTALLLPATVLQAAGEAPEYLVQDGMVDKGTYNGYRRFHGTCHACHGQDAMGSSFAPALTESMQNLDYAVFVETVTNGRQSTGAAGAVSAMPGFAQDKNVMKHIDDIYRYIKARADGALAPGRPKKIPKK